uniref:Uncharacterized protein n=1 Tax=Euplotes crassus TaxID=5936 RepID=A0A7S3KKY7_EUPCR
MKDSSDITVEVWDVYFSFGYFVTLLNVLTIYMMLILMEAYRYIALIYINKKGQISKVTIFGALHGFFVVIIILVFEQTSVFDRIFVGMITVAYFLLFISKYVQSRAGKKSTTGKKLIFKRIFRREEFATQLISASKIQIKDNYYHSSFTTVGSGTGDRTSVFSNYFQARSTKVKASNYAQITNKDTEEGGKANLSVNRASKKDASINMSIASESQSET